MVKPSHTRPRVCKRMQTINAAGVLFILIHSSSYGLIQRIKPGMFTAAFLQEQERLLRPVRSAQPTGWTVAMDYTSLHASIDDINAAWRFASLHGSNIGVDVVNGQSHHPFSQPTQFYLTHESHHENGGGKSTSTPGQTLQQSGQTTTNLHMPKIYQGVYQLTNEEEYR